MAGIQNPFFTSNTCTIFWDGSMSSPSSLRALDEAMKLFIAGCAWFGKIVCIDVNATLFVMRRTVLATSPWIWCVPAQEGGEVLATVRTNSWGARQWRYWRSWGSIRKEMKSRKRKRITIWNCWRPWLWHSVNQSSCTWRTRIDSRRKVLVGIVGAIQFPWKCVQTFDGGTSIW